MRRRSLLAASAVIVTAVAVFFLACADSPAEPMGAPVFSVGTNKVVLCHDNGTDQYVRIEIADPALPAHLEHGDAGPGEAVPGVPGKRFTETCELEDIPVSYPLPVEEACPCWTLTELQARSWDNPGETEFDAMSARLGPNYPVAEFHSMLDGVQRHLGVVVMAPPYCGEYDSNSVVYVWQDGLTDEQAEACRYLLLYFGNTKGYRCMYGDAETPWCDPFPAVPNSEW